MNTKMDDRSTLVKLIKGMSDLDLQQMLAYAAGYEAGKFSQINLDQHGNLQEQTFKKSVPNQVVKKQTNQMSIFDLDDQNRRMG